MPFSPVGSYEPLVELASGGMGVVYVARKRGDAGFERLVAIKRVRREVLADAAYRHMLREEARLLSLVHHANVASVLDVVESDGELSIVLEYIESISLSALLAAAARTRARMPVSVAARIVADALAGLHAAHVTVDANGSSLGIIHRDVSPQNVLVGVDGVSRLIDFGIAKASRATSQSGEQTDSGVLKGKLRYMSPEQLVQGTLDARSDVYSAGVVLYEAVTGQRLFRPDVGESAALLNQLIGNVAPPSELVSDLPPAAEDVIMKALERERDDRFQTAAEFEEALTRAVPVASRSEVARFVASLTEGIFTERRDRIRQAAQVVSRKTSAASVAPMAVAVLVAMTALGVAAAIVVVRRVAHAGSTAAAPPRAVETATPSETATDQASAARAASPDADAGASPSSRRPTVAPPHVGRPELHKNPYGQRRF